MPATGVVPRGQALVEAVAADPEEHADIRVVEHDGDVSTVASRVEELVRARQEAEREAAAAEERAEEKLHLTVRARPEGVASNKLTL